MCLAGFLRLMPPYHYGLQVDADMYRNGPHYKMLCDTLAHRVRMQVKAGYGCTDAHVIERVPEVRGWPFVSWEKRFDIIVNQEDPKSKAVYDIAFDADSYGESPLQFRGLLLNALAYLMIFTVGSYCAIRHWQKRVGRRPGFPVIEAHELGDQERVQRREKGMSPIIDR